jgi:aspartate aminotransferase
MAERFTTAGARVLRPEGGFYIYPDFEDLREQIGVRTSAELAALLLDRYGVGVLPGSAFGDPPEALRLRVATSLLYGETDEQRLAALAAEEPAGLPWIAAALDRTTEVLADLTAGAPCHERERVAVTA